jgi:hypothetical protein
VPCVWRISGPPKGPISRLSLREQAQLQLPLVDRVTRSCAKRHQFRARCDVSLDINDLLAVEAVWREPLSRRDSLQTGKNTGILPFQPVELSLTMVIKLSSSVTSAPLLTLAVNIEQGIIRRVSGNPISLQSEPAGPRRPNGWRLSQRTPQGGLPDWNRPGATPISKR